MDLNEKITVHTIKCWPQYFERVVDKTKTFEVRVNDRGYQKGDVCRMREFDPKQAAELVQAGRVVAAAGYSGREVMFTIGYVYPIPHSESVVLSILGLRWIAGGPKS